MAEHERDGWFIEKYDPITIFEARMEQRAQAQSKSAHLLQNMHLMIDLEVNEDADIPHNNEAPHYCFDVNERTILLKQVPVFMTRNEIRAQINQVAQLQGHLEEMSFSDPLKMHNFERFAWLTFDTEEAASIALQELDGIVVKVPEAFAS